MADERPMSDELRAFFERVQAKEGGYRQADTAMGMPGGTCWRWLHDGITPSADNLRKVAETIGDRYGVTPLHLFIIAGYLPADATAMPRIASPSLNAALLAIQDDMPLEDALAAERAAQRAIEPWRPAVNPRGTPRES